MRVIKITGLLILLLNGLLLQGQEMAEGPNFPEYPFAQMNSSKGGITLPLKVDNSRQPWFRPVFSQYGWSCNQASSIGYLLTYELNRQRNLSSDSIKNQYPPLYVWNFLNSNSSKNGASYFDSWEIIKANGCPTYYDFPYWSNSTVWLTGYDKYLRAMKNKVLENYSISVADVSGLRVLKTYLFNHNDSYPFGGLANFQIGSTGMHYEKIPQGSVEAGKTIITRFGNIVGHAMTIVGYNDEIKFDFNGDGKYTNDKDINHDGVVDLYDWEIGALLVVNSWGKDWGDRGKAYIPYRLLTQYGYEGGFWNRSVHVINVLPDYEPTLTMKLEMVHSSRNMIRISAGVSSDPEADSPDYIHNFPLFYYQGGEVSMGGPGPGDHMEIGLDITPLLTYVEPGKPTRFFVLVDEDDPTGRATGMIYNFEVINYFDGDTVTASTSGEYALLDDRTTILGVSSTVNFGKIKIPDYSVQYTEPYQWMTFQLQAEGLHGPGKWEIVQDYTEDSLSRPFPEITGTVIPRNFGSEDHKEIELPFAFPFFGVEHDKIYLDEGGAILLETDYQDYPYAVDPDLAFKQRKSIVPFGHELSYFSTNNRMYYYDQDSLVTVFWDAMASIGGTSVNIRFACNLYPDGLIEFHYSDYNLFRATRASYKSGLSRGDGKGVIFTEESTMGFIVPNQVVQLRPMNIPRKCKIESNGLLFCRPEEENALYNIQFKVTDNNFQQAYGVLPISTLDFSSSELIASSFPNPFSDQTSLSFLVPEDIRVVIELFDHAGRMLTTLVEADYEIGQYTVKWNGKVGGHDLPSGIYYGRITQGDHFELVKMMKLR